MEELLLKILEGQERTSTQIASVNEKLISLEARFSNFEDDSNFRFSTLEENFNTRFSTLENTFNSNLSNLEENFNTRFSTLEDTFNSNLSNLEENFNTRFSTLEDNFNTKFFTLEDKLSASNEQIANIKEDISSIKLSVTRIERHQEDSIMGMLKHIKHQSEMKESQIQILNKRLFEVEAKTEQQQ